MNEDEKQRLREHLPNPSRRYVTGLIGLCVAFALAAVFWLIRALL